MSIQSSEICMETTYSRQKKSKTSFKGVLNKVIVSGLVLATVAGMSTPAFAAELNSDKNLNAYASSISYSQGISVESAISNIKATIKTINGMISNGSVSTSALNDLASQLYQLETAVKSVGSVSSDVISVLDSAENALNNVASKGSISAQTEAYTALLAVRATIDNMDTTVTVSNKDANVVTVKGFTDVDKNAWYFAAVDACRARGAISGTTKVDGNGMSKFDPNAPVSRAAFLKIAVNACLGENAPAQGGENWWSSVYDYATGVNIIDRNYYPNDNAYMSADISRYEMAEIINNCCDILLKKSAPDATLAQQLGDYYTISNTRYKTDVCNTFARGIITGFSDGTYGGTSNGTRAQAAQMVAKMMDYVTATPPSSSKPIYTENDGSTTPAPTARTLKWNDASRPYAREGDTFVDKNGKSWKLTVDAKTGVVGYGVPIATDLGRYEDGETVTDGGYVTTLSRPEISGNQYLVNPYTGEGHWIDQWGAISREYTPTTKGTKDGQLSADKNFVWSTVIGGWTMTCVQGR